MKIWNILGSIRLSFRLLISGSIVLFAGSLYTNANFSFFQSLSQTPIQLWLLQHLFSDPQLVWWIPVLFFIMSLLGINILVCAIQRIIHLFSTNEQLGSLHFFHKLTPTIIHLLFPVIMTGHLVTFTMGQWHRFPINEGGSIKIDGNPPITVQSVTNTYYPEKSLMRKRLLQTHVKISCPSQEELNLTFLQPVRMNGSHLHLDMIKKRFRDQKKEIQPPPVDQETCNKAEVYLNNQQHNTGQKLLLLTVKDPGLYLICIGLFLILILMAWYFSYPFFKLLTSYPTKYSEG